MTYQKAEIESDNYSVGDRNGSKFDITQMTSESLGDDVHGEARDTTEYGRAND